MGRRMVAKRAGWALHRRLRRPPRAGRLLRSAARFLRRRPGAGRDDDGGERRPALFVPRGLTLPSRPSCPERYLLGTPFDDPPWGKGPPGAPRRATGAPTNGTLRPSHGAYASRARRRLAEARAVLAHRGLPAPEAPREAQELLPRDVSFEDPPAPAPPGSAAALRRQAWARMIPERCSRWTRSGARVAALSWRSSSDHAAFGRRRDPQAPPRTRARLPAPGGPRAAGGVVDVPAAVVVGGRRRHLRAGPRHFLPGPVPGTAACRAAPRPVSTGLAGLR